MFFGESLPREFQQLQKDDFPKCDLLIVMGTALAVAPFNSLVNLPKLTVPRILLNREVVAAFENYKENTNYRDVVELGDCDASVAKFEKLLGWNKQTAKAHKCKTSGVKSGVSKSNVVHAPAVVKKTETIQKKPVEKKQSKLTQKKS